MTYTSEDLERMKRYFGLNKPGIKRKIIRKKPITSSNKKYAGDISIRAKVSILTCRPSYIAKGRTYGDKSWIAKGADLANLVEKCNKEIEKGALIMVLNGSYSGIGNNKGERNLTGDEWASFCDLLEDKLQETCYCYEFNKWDCPGIDVEKTVIK